MDDSEPVRNQENPNISTELIDVSVVEKPVKPYRLYNIWKGNQNFLMHGKVVVGPKSKMLANYIFLDLLGILTIIFHSILLKNLDPSLTEATTRSYSVVLVSILTFYTLTIVTEAGIIPPSSIKSQQGFLKSDMPKEQIIPQDKSEYSNPEKSEEKKIDEDELKKHESLKRDKILTVNEEIRVKEIYPELISDNINQQFIEDPEKNEPKVEEQNVKLGSIDEQTTKKAISNDIKKSLDSELFCSICDIDRSKKSRHCATCNSCVQYFFCHSKLLNVCIGKRNLRFYITFVLFGFFALVFYGFCVYLSIFKTSEYSNKLYQIMKTITVIEAIFVIFTTTFAFSLFLKSKLRSKTKTTTINEPNTREDFPDILFISEPLVNFSMVINQQRP
jgi:hypothetical protein